MVSLSDRNSWHDGDNYHRAPFELLSPRAVSITIRPALTNFQNGINRYSTGRPDRP